MFCLGPRVNEWVESLKKKKKRKKEDKNLPDILVDNLLKYILNLQGEYQVALKILPEKSLQLLKTVFANVVLEST